MYEQHRIPAALSNPETLARVKALIAAAGSATPEGSPVHSFPTLLADLANLVLNRIRLPTRVQTAITIATEPSRLQRRAFDLLGVDPQQNVSITVTG